METARDYWSRIQRINAANSDIGFTLIAIFFVIVGVVTIPEDVPEGTTFRQFDGLATTFVVVQAASVAFLRRWPLAVVVVSFGAIMAQAIIGYDVTSVSAYSVLVIIFFVAATRPLIQAVGVELFAAVVIATLYVLASRHTSLKFDDIMFTSGFFIGVWVAGAFVYSRRSKVQQVERYAAEVEERSVRAAEEGAAEERVRIAHELHDAVGHTLNLIVVQAGAAQRVRERNPEAAYDALRSIESAGRQALNDMDRMLGILREPAGDESDGDGLGPRPGLARLDALLDEARRAGLEIEHETAGEARKLPASVDLTAYRVVQEAITNVMKHAPGAKTKVKIEYDPSAVSIEVSNGKAVAPVSTLQQSGGRGLAGMRERVTLFGGSMSSSSTPGGGFVVRVSIPISGAA
jgi:signal transduction histidine kinase